jgi:hypothetical protein
MVNYSTTIRKFEEKGDKTGWTYIEIPSDIAEELNPGNKKSFKIKGKLDAFAIKQMTALPMGDGSYIVALNAGIRKGIGKRAGARIEVEVEKDDSIKPLSAILLECLQDAPVAKSFFESLAPSHQRYFSNWVEEAKTDITRANRLAVCIAALERGMAYGPMIREQKAKRI